MQPVILWTDFFIYLLIIAIVISSMGVACYPHLRKPWGYVAKQPIAMVSFVILMGYLSVGLLDSIHFRMHSSEVTSVFDYMVRPLGSVDEKSYTAPFAVRLNPHDQQSVRDIFLAVIAKVDCIGVCFLFLFAGVFYFRRVLFYRFNFRCHPSASWDPGEKLDSSLRWDDKKSSDDKEKWDEKKRWWATVLCTLFFMVSASCVALELSAHYHILGTDKVGQDVFYQSLKSIRTGLTIGLITSFVVLPFAIGLGISAGYFGGFIDDVIQYIYTTLSSVPGVLLISAAVLSMQIFIANHAQHFTTIMQRADLRLLALCVILGVTGWTPLCRLLRGEAMKLRQVDFVVAAVALGASPARIIFKHILPNVMHIVIITLVLDFSGLVLAEAVLSYVGVGVDPTTISWGNIINSARLELAREPVVWWPLCSAFLFMFMLVLSVNLFADAVRDAFDPRR